MGDSSQRAEYSVKSFATEVIGVCSALGFVGPPVMVGHSFGGFVALKAAAIYGKELAGIVMVDFPIRPPARQQEQDAERRTIKRKRDLSDPRAALAGSNLFHRNPATTNSSSITSPAIRSRN